MKLTNLNDYKNNTDKIIEDDNQLSNIKKAYMESGYN